MKDNISWKWVITTGIAVLAFLLSGLNTYFQFFSTKVEAWAVISSIKVREEKCIAKIGFSNQGDHTIIVDTIQLIIPHLNDSKHTTVIGEPKHETGEFFNPLIIKPEEAFTRTITWGFDIKELIKESTIIKKLENGWVEINTNLQFFILDQSFNWHNVSSNRIQFRYNNEEEQMFIGFSPDRLKLLPSPKGWPPYYFHSVDSVNRAGPFGNKN